MHHFIDGYNVIHKSRTLGPIVRQDFERAREILIERIALFCIATGHQATIVFDGQARHRPETVEHYRHVPGLSVVYSPAKVAADTVIERYVYQASARLEIVVVSNDRGLRDLCRNMGALVMEADAFLGEVRASQAGTSETLLRTQTPHPGHLEDRLDESSLGRLRALREKIAPKDQRRKN